MWTGKCVAFSSKNQHLHNPSAIYYRLQKPVLKCKELHPSPKIPPQVQLRGSLPIPENFDRGRYSEGFAVFIVPLCTRAGWSAFRLYLKCLAHAPGGAESTSSALAELTVFCNKCVRRRPPSSMSPWFASAKPNWDSKPGSEKLGLLP